MDEKASAPPAYPGTESGEVGHYNPNYQTDYGHREYQGAPPTYSPGQPITYPPTQQAYGQQQMANNIVIGGGYGGYGSPAYQTVPQDYTTQAWIACLCCFWPTGILAIMKATESRDRLARGDLIGANVAANSARQMVKISYIVGIISIIFAGVMFGVLFGLVYTSNYNY